MTNSQIISSGHYLPETVLTNNDLATRLDTSDEWITKRTGIKYRHIAAKNQRCSDLALIAAQRALDWCDLTGKDIDLTVLATTTPDHTFPATAVRIQHALGCQGAAYDIQAVCAGFIFALVQADNAIRLGQVKRALVIGSEVNSRILDWEDRETCVLFGDGAGAIILESSDYCTTRMSNILDSGILDIYLASDGQCYHNLFVNGGVFDSNIGVVKMIGREVYKGAIIHMSEVITTLLARQSLSSYDLDWLIPHQANLRILEQVSERLRLPSCRLVSTVDRHANISAATIPTALDIAWRDGRLNTGQLVGLTAMGGGFSWGGVLWRIG